MGLRSRRARSNIRRVLDRNEDRIREHRRRVLAGYYNQDSRRETTSAGTIPAPPATTDNTGTRSGSEHGHRALRDASRRLGLLDDRAVTMFGERWAHLHVDSNPNPSPLRDDSNDPESILNMAVDVEFMNRHNRGSQLRLEPTYALSNIRSTQTLGPLVSITYPPPALPGSDMAQSRNTSRPQSTVWSRMRRQRSALRDDLPLGPAPAGPDAWMFDTDGLGDRNRSLSPEGDNGWATLQTTLTPDPQPPSVGSSFASASAAATQSTAAASSRTSFTTLDRADDLELSFEPPCESGCDNSDTEGDEEDEMGQIPYIPGSSFRRRNVDDDPVELFGGIGGMQRIVRNLALREDIPDEWWADAGLSRTLSRETSGN
ncbi:hypothetical protein CHGG_02659 [Chaetomium globosum CBS 148.51]|uniref:Uncharacterized protein n=1 Tax=Chaetomium globosum (strain ATCC 6205 / CBS 148.51 / DSM 1962 / NBRC 6347 / NRRL 1970) TaxID=306901 RepID=Q2HAU5_CHAGB|nr:uncharacterized protein CHGG_02659 [Chaetomium globosum CBS 148.51]EAQ90724.1 hypothetical protein CHGG_02659 [Chaetomium globosum CBS 148.51]